MVVVSPSDGGAGSRWVSGTDEEEADSADMVGQLGRLEARVA
jgi:hypothetical protein